MENNKQEEKKETLTQIGSIEAQSLDQASRQPQLTYLDTKKHATLIRTLTSDFEKIVPQNFSTRSHD
jgi:hypothetical protein